MYCKYNLLGKTKSWAFKWPENISAKSNSKCIVQIARASKYTKYGEQTGSAKSASQRAMRAIYASIFFSSTGLRGRQLFAKKHRSRARLSLNYRYKPLTRHLESGDDPGDEYKRYNLAPRVLSFPGKLILNKFSYKSAENWKVPSKNPNLASVARTIAGASNMKNALNICTSCQVLRHSNGCPDLDEFFLLLFYIFVMCRKVCLFKSSRIRKT